MHRTRIIGLGVVLLLASCQPQPDAEPPAPPPEPEVAYFQPEAAALRTLPFSEAVRVGNMLYLSGMLGTLPGEMQLAPGGIQGETRQTMENIKQALERHGSSLDRVVKCTVMLADIGEWSAMNEVYVTFFKDHFPARSALGASGLALDARVEIECMATVG